MLANSNQSFAVISALDAAVCEFLGSHAHSLAQSEALTVTLMLDARVGKATHSTQSRDTALLTMRAFPVHNARRTRSRPCVHSFH